jgi:hypothetical protein
MRHSIKFAFWFGALFALGCAAGQTAIRNVTAADCASPAAEALFVAQLPQIAFITNNQAVALMDQFCVMNFGTVAAPTPAPGMAPMFPGPTPAPTPVAAVPPTSIAPATK